MKCRPTKPAPPVIRTLRIGEMSPIELERPNRPAGQIGRYGVRILRQIPNERQIVLVAQILAAHVFDQVMLVAMLIDRGGTEGDLKALRLNIVGRPDVIHAPDNRDEAFELIRSLIFSVVLAPGTNARRIDLEGDRDGIISLCDSSKKPATSG